MEKPIYLEYLVEQALKSIKDWQPNNHLQHSEELAFWDKALNQRITHCILCLSWFTEASLECKPKTRLDRAYYAKIREDIKGMRRRANMISQSYA